MTATVHDIGSARSPVDFALSYVRLGWWVLPLEPGTKKPFGRLVHNGFHDATNDADTARRWWQQHADAGIGVALKKSGLVAVDIDPRNGGIDTIDQLEHEHGPIVSDVMAFTGGGGEHRVFAAALVENLPGKLGPGVDLKADGYIAVEPTLHPSGRRYAWEASSDPLDGIVPSTLPAWIRDLGRGKTPSPAVPAAAPAPPIDPRRRASAEEALRHIASDDRDTWVRVGAAIHNEMPSQAGFDLWDAWSQTSSKYDAQDQLRVWRSFRRKGLAGLGLNSVFAMAQQAGWKNAGAPAAANQQQASGALPLVFAETITADSIRILQLVEDTITQGGLSVMYGESNSGKSFLACDMACSVGSGTQWLGKRTVRGAVLYVAGEGAESIKLRVLAWRQRRGVEPALAVVPVAVNLLDPKVDVQRVVDACKAVEQHYGMPVSLIIIDTLARAFGGGNENASEDMGAVIAHADVIRSESTAHVLFVHHSGKDSAKGSRGHSSLKAATDTEIEVTGDEGTKLHTAEFVKQRDLPTRGEKVTGKFVSVRMGTGQWNKPITTCVVETTDERPAGPSKRQKGGELRMAVVSVLSTAPNRTMKRALLVKALTDSGFTSSPIYRALGELVRDGATTESMGSIHLNNMPTEAR